jgi:simple sugar transport system permease protein
VNVVGNFLFLAVASTIPIIVTAMGGMFAERARATNIALDGTMLMSALAAISMTVLTGSPWIGVLAAIVAGMAYASLLAFAAYVLKSDILISGIAANMLATGLALLIVQNVLGSTGTYTPPGAELMPRLGLGPIGDVPVLGAALNGQSLFLYIVVLGVIAGAITLARTRWGTHVRVVGESDEAALAAGINPTAIRVSALLVSGALAGIGGAYLTLSSVATFTFNLTGGIGFIAFAAVIFGRATPAGTIAASLIFGAATALAISLQGLNVVDQQLLHSMPYVAAIAALAFRSIRQSRTNRHDVSDTSFLPAIVPRG